MAEIVNLRRQRRRKVREKQADEAARNRARFGRTGAERRQEEGLKDLARRRLDGHVRDDRPGE